MLKVCNKCGKEKNITVKEKSSKDGYRSVCSDCFNTYNREYRRLHPEKIKQWNLVAKKNYRTKFKKQALSCTDQQIYFLYQIYNIVTGEQYIGKTNNPDYRKVSHFSDLVHRHHPNNRLQDAFDTYGKDNLKFSILVIGSKSFINWLETRAIKNLSPAYNKWRGPFNDGGGHVCAICGNTKTIRGFLPLCVSCLKEYTEPRSKFKDMPPWVKHLLYTERESGFLMHKLDGGLPTEPFSSLELIEELEEQEI